MSAAQDTVHEYLRKRFDHLYVDPDDGEVAVPIGMAEATIWLRALVQEGRELVAVSSGFPVRTPAYLLSTMSEYLQRCSARLSTGCFRLDFESGAVFFRTAQFYRGTTLEKEHVAHLVDANLQTTREVLPGMLAVVCGGMAPKDAVDLPAWPKRALDDNLNRVLGEILGSESEAARASEEAETAGCPDSACSPENSTTEPESAPAAHTEPPAPATDGDDRARVLDCLQDLLRQIAAEAERASDETEDSEDDEAVA